MITILLLIIIALLIVETAYSPRLDFAGGKVLLWYYDGYKRKFKVIYDYN